MPSKCERCCGRAAMQRLPGPRLRLILQKAGSLSRRKFKPLSLAILARRRLLHSNHCKTFADARLRQCRG